MGRRFIFLTSFLVVTTLLFFTSSVFGQKVSIPFGSTWKYLDDGSDQGTAWQEFSFDDSNWKSGKAQLGYGDDGEVTVISYGEDSQKKHITTYFRKKIEILNPKEYLGFTLKLRYDDGGVVYLNGREIFRANMRKGEVKYNILAIGGSGEDETFLSNEQFENGVNIIAVEIHQSNSRSSDIAFDLELSEADKIPDFIRKPPYLLYNGNETEMELHWQVTTTAPSFLSWGIDTTYSFGQIETSEFGSDHQHKYIFTKLEQNKKYHYQVAINDESYKGSFYSAPDQNTKDINFLVFGDTRSFPKDHDKVAKAMIEAYTVNKNYQTLLFCVGDLVGNGNSESNWDKQFFSLDLKNVAKLHANVPLQAVIGNHEGSGELFQKYFPHPFIADRYWSFDYGPAHFVVYDQYIRTIEGREKQLQWLENDLAKTKKQWKFLLLHEPGWSAGGGHNNHPGVQFDIQPLCKKYGVSVVFGGHNHYYARAVVDSIQHVTTGGGGAPLYEPEIGQPNVVKQLKINHFCKLEIKDNNLNYFAVDWEGNIFDQFIIELSKTKNP